MKKNLFILATLFLLLRFSCESPRYFYYYYINNNCNEEIDVDFEINATNYSNPQKSKIQISSKTMVLIYIAETTKPISDDKLEYFFKKITVSKEGKNSKINFVNKELWAFKKTSDNHSYSYLTVSNEDF